MEEVLGLSHIDIRKRFSDQGGNSINAITLMHKMKKAGFLVTLRDIMHHQTIEEIVKEVLHPVEARLIDSATGLEACIYKQMGVQVYCRTIQVQHNQGIDRKSILLAGAGREMSIKQFIGTSILRIAPAIVPHYICSMEVFGEIETETLLEESVFYTRMGLLPLASIDITLLQQSLEKGLLQNDNIIRKTAKSTKYPLCAMQQLQIAFHTPASLDFLLMETYVDMPVLQQAYSMLIKRHNLLRSVAVKEDGFYYWEEHVYDPAMLPAIPVVDLGDYQCHHTEFYDLVKQLVFRIYNSDTILHQFVLFRKNLKEHYLVMIFSHVIFDRVTGEVLKSQLLNYYNDLLNGREVRQEQIIPFETYVQQIGKGPQQISEQEVIRTFQLEDFYKAKELIRNGLRGKESGQSYSFSIVVPLPGAIQQHNMLESTLAIYTKALHRYLEITQLPLLFVCDGREYENKQYYNTVGEFTDMIPMLIDAGHTAAGIGMIVSQRLADLKQYNLNFLHLLLDPVFKAKWPEAGRLIDAGAQFERFDILMFNFLGNAEEVVIPASEEVDIQPNPLPIYSLLNCIASGTADKIVFSFRSSYSIDIDKLKGLFRDAALEVAC
jgi:aryl carrier-like protein